MGHIRLGRLPRTRRWQEVVGLVGGGGDAFDVANATMDAVQQDLAVAVGDPGVVESVFLLTQIPEAARAEDFGARLRDLGVRVSDQPSLAELASAITSAVDRQIQQAGRRTDLGEMARVSAVEAITAITGARAPSLFGTTPDDVQRELGRLATKKQFGGLAQEFFARFTERTLTYWVSRELPTHVGEGRRFDSAAEQRAFQDAVGIHARQASRIVETFAGGWFSKARYEGRLDRENTAKFVAYALKKMRTELRQGSED